MKKTKRSNSGKITAKQMESFLRRELLKTATEMDNDRLLIEHWALSCEVDSKMKTFNELPDDERMNGSERAMDILAVLRVLQARLAEDAMEITKRIKNKTLVIK